MNKPEDLFTVNIKKHTNFAIQCIPVDVPSQATFGQTVKVDIPFNGDLLYKGYLILYLNDILKWDDDVAYNFIKHIDFRFNEYVFDEYTNEEIKSFNDLYKNSTIESLFIKRPVMFIPLHFWFTKNSQNALPLLSLKDTVLSIYVTFSERSKLLMPEYLDQPFPKIKFLFDYVFLSDEERYLYIGKTLEYITKSKVNMGTFNFRDIDNDSSLLGRTIYFNSEVISNIEIDFFSEDSTIAARTIYNYLKNFNVTLEKQPWLIGPYTLGFLRYPLSHSYKFRISKRLLFNLPFSLMDNNIEPTGFFKIDDDWRLSFTTLGTQDTQLELKLKYKLTIDVIKKLYIKDGKFSETLTYQAPDFAFSINDDSDGGDGSV